MAPPRLTLYRADGACSLASHALLTHLGVPFTSVRMKMTVDNPAISARFAPDDGSMTHDEYVATVHPGGLVPALKVEEEAVDGSTTTSIITEGPVVMTYLASAFAPELAGGDDVVRRAKVQEWLVWLAGTLQCTGLKMVYQPATFVGEDAGDEALGRVRERGRRLVVDRCFPLIEARLERQQAEGRKGSGEEEYYAVGDGLTSADFFLLVFYRVGALVLGVDMREAYPRWTGLMRRVEALDAYQKTLRIEKLDLVFADEKQ